MDVWGFSMIVRAVASGDPVRPPALADFIKVEWLHELVRHSGSWAPRDRHTSAQLLDFMSQVVRQETRGGPSGSADSSAASSSGAGSNANSRSSF